MPKYKIGDTLLGRSNQKWLLATIVDITDDQYVYTTGDKFADFLDSRIDIEYLDATKGTTKISPTMYRILYG